MISSSFILSKNDLTLIDSNLDLKSALNILDHGNFLSLPVVEGTSFLGVVSKEKILQQMMDAPNPSTTVASIVRKDIPNLHIEDDVEEAALLLAETNTPFVAMKDENENFVGIITHKTIFKHYANIFGIKKGQKLIINTYDVKGRLALLTDIISKSGANILSLLVDNPNVSTNVVKIIVRVESSDINKLKLEIENNGFSVRQ
ncbi:CBS domain-containing protein [Alkaliphilus transvaalensis]|uniref:CBS domain-containing protein n=1 Tax=Alkaliphilus transvaalensis TaxID=114628 RepID=UPI000478EF4C|nr:CBS domain-containing protein [Alkaliphilus transvaalensis]